MYNKKNSGLKVVGIVAGTIAGISAIAAGAYLLYKRYMEKKVASCCECEIGDECECHGKYACACACEGDCLVEEAEQLTIEDFEGTDENTES